MIDVLESARSRLPSEGLAGMIIRLAKYMTVLIVAQAVIVLAPMPAWLRPMLVFFALGAVFVWVFVREAGWDYIDIRRPTLRDLGLIAVVIVIYYGAVAIYAMALHEMAPAVSPASHDAVTEQTAELDYATTLFVLGVLIAAPVEELIFRNGLQKALYGRLGGIGAVVATSLFFASLHIPAYGGLATGIDTGLLVSLSVVFLGSALYGIAYLMTENLVVSILLHGITNGTAIVGAYLGLLLT